MTVCLVRSGRARHRRQAVKTFALTINLQNDPDRIRRYVEEHTRVWPEVLAQIREIGIQQMKIWHVGDQLFMYLEADDDFDVRRDFGRTREDPRSVEWNDWMAREFQQRSPFAAEGEWWALMTCVFDLKAALGEPTA
jgi:L-rhamnose mutarotase